MFTNKYYEYMMDEVFFENEPFLEFNEFHPNQIIGSGGNGYIIKIIPIKSDIEPFVLKLFYSSSYCENADKEYDKMLKFFESFNNIFNFRLDPEIDNLIKFIKPVIPFGYFNCPIKFNDREYKCGLIMSLIDGFDTSKIIIPNLNLKYNEEFKKELPDLFQSILVMPIQESFKEKIIISLKVESDPISLINPVRYGIILVSQIGLLNSDPEILTSYPKIMGIIQAIMLFGTKLTTNDLEILLGPNNESYQYNIVDLGATEDIKLLVQKVLCEKSDSDLDILSDKITDVSGLFFTKVSFPNDTDSPAFNEFIKYFKLMSKIILEPICLYDESLVDGLTKLIKSKLC